MGVIQNSINSMLGSTAHAVVAARTHLASKKGKLNTPMQPQNSNATSPQKIASQKARQSMLNAIQAKSEQRMNFTKKLNERMEASNGIHK